MNCKRLLHALNRESTGILTISPILQIREKGQPSQIQGVYHRCASQYRDEGPGRDRGVKELWIRKHICSTRNAFCTECSQLLESTERVANKMNLIPYSTVQLFNSRNSAWGPYKAQPINDPMLNRLGPRKLTSHTNSSLETQVNLNFVILAGLPRHSRQIILS